MSDATLGATPFHDLDAFIGLPRLTGLAMSPDGRRLVTTVAELDAKRTAYESALWQVDPAGEYPAHRLTRSVSGDANATFSGSGDLYFTSRRSAGEDVEAKTSSDVWMLPQAGGEARQLTRRAGGVTAIHAARTTDRVVVTASILEGAASEQEDETLRSLRKERGVSAILHSSLPIRYWNEDLGPDQVHLQVLETSEVTETDGLRILRDLTATSDHDLRWSKVTLAPDGTFLLVSAASRVDGLDPAASLGRIDVAAGGLTILVKDDDMDYTPGPVSPDGQTAVVVVQRRATATRAPGHSLGLLELSTGVLTVLADHWDRWATPVAWFPDGASILAIADHDGRAPLFVIEVATGEVRQLTHDDAAYSEAVIHPDGTLVFGLRSSVGYPPEVVRVDVRSGVVTRLPNPTQRPAIPGQVEEVETISTDGTRIRAWLALPDGTGAAVLPAPLAVFVHGGPMTSWKGWSWRWTPWLLVSAGYAVLMPDPAMSTGYGQDFVQRGWGRWGANPYTDLMDIIDVAEARADIDGLRTCALGASFGGYMVNWMAGHTDRFAAIVSHASIWALDLFEGSTDVGTYVVREMTAEMAYEYSPRRFIDKIVTPMLVVHGDRDYRVPVSEGVRLWYDLLAHSGRPAASDGTTDHRMLYFPDEDHFVSAPQNAKLWNEVVRGFLDSHVNGIELSPPAPLGLVRPSA